MEEEQVPHLAVRRRRSPSAPASESVPLQLAQNVNEAWSMDFVSDSLANGRLIKFLTSPTTSATSAWTSRWTGASLGCT
jgi:hypothetical protein